MSAWGNLSGLVGGCLTTALLVALALYLPAEQRAFKASAVQGVATVVAHKQTRRRDSAQREKRDEFDVYEFTTPSGQTSTFTSPNSLLRPRRAVGERAAIIYQAADPAGARLDDASIEQASRWLLWCSPIGLVIGSIFLAVWLRRARRTAPALG
jgi:hypothetical protein